MIVTCEKCNAQFNLNEDLISEEGSKVRCSRCRHVFKVLPPKPEYADMLFGDDNSDIEIEETISLDSPPPMEAVGQSEHEMENKADDFDRAFEETLQEDIPNDDNHEPLESVLSLSQENDSHLKLILVIAAVVIIIFLLSAFAVWKLAPGLLPGSPSGEKTSDIEDILDSGNLMLEFGELDSRFLEAGEKRQLFIIKGTVINNYPESRSHILVRGTIEDDNKNPIRNKQAYAGNIYSDRQLKEMTIEEIDTGLNNQAGIDNANINVKPGEEVSFMIIFENLPKNLGHFEIETLSSTPAE